MFALRPERAITASEEDRFARGKFIEQIGSSLIAADGQHASGIVLGLVGDWGSGKSSVLNLLKKNIEETHETSVVVQFNPWLISGHDDLVASFFSALIDGINEKHVNFPFPADWQSQRAEEAIKAIGRYGAELSSVLNFVKPGLGPAGKLVVQALNPIVEKYFQKRKSLLAKKKAVSEALKEIRVPIVVLIDELDRVEDSEVRLMAQLVRAIADLDQISYVLAYDERRVAEALGSSQLGRTARLERGYKYLEKVVQLTISMPIAFASELHDLLSKDVAAVLKLNGIDTDLTRHERYRALVEIVIADGLATACDIKKAAAALHLRLPLVNGDVEWVDVLGFAILEMKAPGTARYVRTYPDRVTLNSRDFAFFARIAEKKMSFDDVVKIISPNHEQEEWIKRLVGFLFPALSRSRSHEECKSDEIAFNGSLYTLLRLAVLPDSVSRKSVMEIVQRTGDELVRTLASLASDGRLDDLLSRIKEIYDELPFNEREFWLAVAEAVEQIGDSDEKDFYQRRTTSRNATEIFIAIAHKLDRFKEDAPALLREMINSGYALLPAQILRSDFFSLGEFGKPGRDPNRALMSRDELRELANKLAGNLLGTPNRVVNADIILKYFLNDMGKWGGREKQTFALRLRTKAEFLDKFVFELFGGGYGSDQSGIEIFIPLDDLKELVRRRVELNSFSSLGPLFRAAYERLCDELDISFSKQLKGKAR